ncbi:MAG: DUF3109 family protein [Bacteroidales bacterium]|nr:DUF3109 family protein [Bacteroidales bacterium]MBQ9311506.1 DUF3109 family protein [Bacteroidales bacterium]
MLVVGNSLVSEDLRDIKFSCNIALCKGQCCVEEGGYGAPLQEKELRIMKKILPKVKKLLPEQSLNIIEKEGFYEKDAEGEWCTKTIEGKDCVFVFKNEKGIPLCAFQSLYLKGETDWIKPVSCHLYPIRVKDYGEFQTVNFEYWKICSSAMQEGEKQGVSLYEYCKEPLIRRFSKQWYDELLEQIKETDNKQDNN